MGAVLRGRVPRLLTPAFGLLVCAHFLASLGFSSMLLLPLYLVHLGADRAEIGAIMASAQLGGLLSRPLVGAALDAWGRKPTLAVGTLVAVVGMGLVALVDRVGPMAWVMRVLFGVGEGAMFASYFTFAADIIPERRRTEGIALFGVSGLLPLAVSPVAALVGVDPPGLRLFLPLLGLAVASSLLFLWPLPEPREEATERRSVGDALRALRAPSLWPVWWATVAFAGLVGLMMAFGTVVAERRGVPFPTGMWFAYAGGATVVRLVGARLLDRIGPANLVAPALAFYVGGVVVAAGAASDVGFLVAGLLAGMGHGTCFPLLTSQVVSRAPQRYRGSALSMFTAIWGASGMVLTPLAGAVADARGDGVMFATAAVLGLVALAAWAALEHRLGRRA